jgi:hypothetical protein
MGDERHEFLCKSISGSINSGDTSSIFQSLESSRDVRDFLDDTRIQAMKATVLEDGSVSFTTDFGRSGAATSVGGGGVNVLFVRRSTEPITPHNIASLLDIQTSRGPPLVSFYNTLKGVWCPTLLENSALAEVMPPRVKHLLAELESALGSSVRSTEVSRGSIDLGNVGNILTPADEIDFWLSIKEDRRSPLKELASGVDAALVDIASPGLKTLGEMPLEEIPDLVARCLDSLNAVWLSVADDGTRYPQTRMTHFMDIIGSSLCTEIQHRHLANLDVWKDRSGDVRLRLQAAIRVLEGWIDVPRKLTSTFWPGCEHQWRGAPHEDAFAGAFKKRLEHVLSIRTISDELAQLLTSEERESFQLDRLFRPLESTHPLQYNPYTEKAWDAAVRVSTRNRLTRSKAPSHATSARIWRLSSTDRSS